MRFYYLLIYLAITVSTAFVSVAQSHFKPAPNTITNETNRQPDRASRYVWGFDNSQNTQTIQGNTEHKFSCFGIGIATSELINYSKILIEYRVNNGQWIKTKPDFSPETIARDNLYWTDLLFTPGQETTNSIEIRAELPQGISLDSLKLHVIDIDFNPKSKPKNLKNYTKSGTCPAYPLVIPRSTWLDPYYTQPAYTPTIINPHHVVIHHGASPDTYTDGAAIVRAYWNYHVNSNGWSDIAYNYLSDKDGNLYIGRMNSDPENQDVRGAHAGASNSESIGVNFLGNSDVTNPTTTQLEAVYQLLGWWFNARGFDPLSSANITLQSGGTASVPRILGHKDVNIGGTSCPGDALYALLDDIRNGTQAAIDACNSLYVYGTSYGDFIDGVQLDGNSTNDISNLNTGATNGPSYTDYSPTHSAELTQAQTYTLSITNGDYSDETLAAWIDYDHDGQFQSDEKLEEITAVDANVTAGITFTVPETALSGDTKMRIRAVWSDINIDASSEYSFGEAEDYGITIIPACETPGIPTNLSTTNVDSESADFSWSAGTPSGSATVSYYWAVGYAGDNVSYDANYLERGQTSTTNAITTVGLNSDTDYKWTVMASTSCDNSQSDYATAELFTTGCITPGSPQNLTENNIANTTVNLAWLANTILGSPNITYYWAINTNSTVDYENNYFQRGSTENLNVNLYGLTPGTIYYWTVRTETSCGVGSTSGYTTAVNFTTTAVPQDIIWTGAESNEWNETSNWSPNQIPTINDDVIIPDVSSASNRYPITQYDLGINNSGATRKCKSLNIEANASVTLTGGSSTVYVNGNLDVFGTLNHECGSNSNKFEINSGGKVEVHENGILNIGSSLFTTVPAETINQYNDISIDRGTLKINPNAKVFVMDNLVVKDGSLLMEGGELWIKYYGDGSANTLGFDVYAAATIDISGGSVYLCGQDDGATAQMLDWNASASVTIENADFVILDEQSSGTNNYTGLLDFGGHAIYNLTINRPSASTALATTNCQINNKLTLESGTFDPAGYNLSLYGDLLNNGGTFTPQGSSVINFYGSDNIIGGTTSSQMDLCDVEFQAESSYLFNPQNVTNFNFMGSFHLLSNSSLEIASGKYLDIYASDSETESVYFYGNLTSTSNYDNVKEIDLNNACNFSGTNVYADIRIYNDVVTLETNMTIYGDLEIYNGGTASTQGALTINSNETLTIYGDFTNNYQFTAASGALQMAGNGKIYTGSSDNSLNDFNILNGASVTINPTNTNGDVDINGSFEVQSDASLHISTGKYLDIYSAAAENESIIINGNISSDDTFNGIQEIDINNTVNLSGNGNLTADLRIFNNETSLTSDFIVDGDLITFKGTSSMGTFNIGANTLTVNGDFVNNYRFDKGSGTVIFAGNSNQTINSGCSNSDCNADSEDINYRRFNHVIVECATAAEVKVVDTHMRADGDFKLKSGTFSTGDATYGKKINIYGSTTIEEGAIFNVGNSVSTSGDVADFHSDLIVRGQITTDRAIIDGFSEVRSYASRLYAQGDVDEINCDMQVYLSAATEQLSDLYISGDLIVQSSNEFTCTNANYTLTIGGHLYIYHDFTHYGTVNLYGDFRENTPIGEEAEICDIASSTFNMYGNHRINFNPSSGFGDLNIMSGTRSVNEIGGHTPYSALDIKGNLTIENGASFDFGTEGKNIDIEGNWIVEGTGDFVTATQKVSFTGSISDQYIYIDPSSTSSFYQLDLNKTTGNLILQSDCEVDTRIDLINGGFDLSQNTLYLSGGTNSINSFMDGDPYYGYLISETDDNQSIFKRNFGTANSKYFPFANTSGESLAMIITNNNSGVDDLGDVQIATYPTGSDNTPLPSTVNFLTAPEITSDVHGQLVNRYWQIDANGTVNNVNVQFTYIDDAWDSYAMTAQRWNGSAWDESPTNSNHNSTNNTVTVSNIGGFSPWVLVKDDWELPVELLKFTAEANESIVDILWVTSNEFNNEYFEIERTLNFENIETIHREAGAGFSNREITYKYTDKKPYSGVSYYRLKQVDFDGAISYSDWQAINIQEHDTPQFDEYGNNSRMKVLGVYPNPTNAPLHILIESDSAKPIQYQIFHQTGTLIKNGELNLQNGKTEHTVDLSSLADGMYVLILTDKTNKSQHKIIIAN
ncbi:MAG: GEVED domain-containing protein [Bacteroidota bacterium]|nr:GEVED domain-containing protein [Bacteroidota bacterium]